MQLMQGIAISPGVAMGQPYVLDPAGYRIAQQSVAAGRTAEELQRLERAIDEAAAKLQEAQQRTGRDLGEDLGAIFSAQQQLLRDPRLLDSFQQLIQFRGYTAEFAISQVLSQYAAAFRRSGSKFLADRANDVRDIERLLLEALNGSPQLSFAELTQPVVVASHDLTPVETVNLRRDRVLAFCTEAGGASGHTAIVARGMEIPAVAGLGPFVHKLRQTDCLLVDGYRGRVIINPDPETIEEYRERQLRRESFVAGLGQLRQLPAITRDGHQIQLLANIEFPSEMPQCQQRGAEGIGLYRTEFLYLGSQREPSEEDHYQAYRRVIDATPHGPVVIRTLDLGADKMGLSSDPEREREPNPFLGLRSIRLSLRNPSLLRTQLRAVLRAAIEGGAVDRVRIMFPMVSTLSELRAARFMLRSIADDLASEGLLGGEQVETGMMVEVPSAVILLDHFVKEIDFVSIGTNDLTQYTLAVDRTNPAVADLYQDCDPAVLRLIKQTVEVCQAAGVGVSVCGEMSSRAERALLLIGLGVESLSLPPAAIPQLKKAVRSVTRQQCQAICWRAMRLNTAREVSVFLQRQLAELVPEMMIQA
jgi:phosphoenolpyruvate-protein phosphotransferase (PTS system enzyme I)